MNLRYFFGCIAFLLGIEPYSYVAESSGSNGKFVVTL
jgi:hypothetical protein